MSLAQALDVISRSAINRREGAARQYEEASMPEQNEPRERVRVNAKQSAKGAWQFEATFEDEAASVDIDGAAGKLLEAINALERRFSADGKEIAGTA